MLRLAGVGASDLLYDLGCGDGQIAVAAAQQCGARAVGVELDVGLLAAARARAEAAGVTERVALLCGDLFESDVRAATVVALYLLDSLNVRLRPKLLAECRPGTRVVSYSFEMGDWEADAHTPIAANGVSLWVIPANFSGRWRVETSAGGFEELHLTQRYQRLGGTIRSGGQTQAIRSGTVKGGELSLTIEDAPGTIFGQLTDGMLSGVYSPGGGESAWSARRVDGTMTRLDAA